MGRIARLLAAPAAVLAALAAGPALAAPSACVPVGGWVQPGSAQPLSAPELFATLAQRRAVLLGEAHDSAEHHRWQLQVLAALHALHPNLVIGFESFPRRVQPALDRWITGAMSEAEFLAAADWRNVWGLDAELSLPLFRFARMNRVPMLALNVDMELTRAVREKGFDAVDTAKREGLTRPAPPLPAYVDL